MLCRCYYAGRGVSSFAQKIKSEYYGGNWSMYIEGITWDHFSAPEKIETETTPQAFTQHVVFHSLLYDDRKQYADLSADK